jgi:hypothetical protein
VLIDYKAGLIPTDFQPNSNYGTRLRTPFFPARVSFSHEFEIEQRFKFGSHFISLGLAYFQSKVNYSYPTGAAGSSIANRSKVFSDELELLGIKLAVGRYYPFKKGLLVPYLKAGLGFYVIQKTGYGSTRNEVSYRYSYPENGLIVANLGCDYQWGFGNTNFLGFKLTTGPYLGVLINNELNQPVFFTGGLRIGLLLGEI